MSAASQQDFALAFLSILFEGAPFILFGTVISGFIDVYLPANTVDRLLPRNPILAVIVAGLLGIILPVCECAVVPVIRRLVQKGLPVSCALTYMLAAPIVNPITALSTWKAFQGQNPALMTSSRLLLGFLIAAVIGLITLRLKPAWILRPSLLAPAKAAHDEHEHAGHDHSDCGEHCCGHHHHESQAGTDSDERLVAAFRSALKDFTDVGVYFTVGVVITALFNVGIAPGAEWLDGLAARPIPSHAALMALAFVLSLCSTSDAFIAATLDKFTWAAKLAFMVFGPMMDVKLIFLYQTVMRRRFVVLLFVALFVLTGAATLCWHLTPLSPK